MDLAIQRGNLGNPSPNPHVGAVVVSGGQVVGVGHHERAGEDHAEIAALREAGPAANRATLYGTLEPCNHTGRTPPCTDAILKAKVARVVVGAHDPNPNVEGGGIDKLREAGVTVDVGCREAECARLIWPWAKFVTTGIPSVVLKLALSLDGRIASRTGSSKWVTGPEARARVHLLRARHDAVMIGIGTALADDPRLTVRDAPGDNPVRVVLDTRLRIPPASRLVQTAREVPTWVDLHDRRALVSGGRAGRARRRGAARTALCRGPHRRPGRTEDAGESRGCERDGGGRGRARRERARRGHRGRAPLLRRAHPARPARSTRSGRLGRPGHPWRGALDRGSSMGSLRAGCSRLGAAEVPAALRHPHGSYLEPHHKVCRKLARRDDESYSG